jgi:hypothetical protein
MKAYDYQGTPTTVAEVIRANVEMAIDQRAHHGGVQQALDSYYKNTIDTLTEMGAGVDHPDGDGEIRVDYCECARAVARKAHVSLAGTMYLRLKEPASDVEIAYHIRGKTENYQRKMFKSHQAARKWALKLEEKEGKDNVTIIWRA